MNKKELDHAYKDLKKNVKTEEEQQALDALYKFQIKRINNEKE